ncbi:translation initiation factor SUI1 [Capsaspora owczarzaki ATCC 30864]|uniref:Translation initiation factor SUI1 n=1 Tax=Capsaspora owczarzaki (strain ATCC 30864) TaxID=595528 RepID=A0A0D2VKV4_CAPO3|nr:translation initiation factor SUI1 [Capsaspora owczarzaki ATCC 30864]KJE90692.1 translation initiation factor SUI1 [Capsaspora owczarzaki ATCC 30864]|eukprot:XP_004364828.1 translation initiation factor SUI1 [Capsaspora owczarzaki ATCC 30864]
MTLVTVQYCPVCTLPYEFCHVGPTPEECKAKLKALDEAMYEKYWSNVRIVAQKLDDLKLDNAAAPEGADGASTSASASGEQAPATGEAAAPAEGEEKPKKPKKEKKKKSKEAIKQVTITLENRNKRKFTTSVEGLAQYGIDLKKAAKLFAGRFACGSAVSGEDLIVIQGDCVDDLMDYLPEQFPEISEDAIEFEEKKASA